MSPPTSASNAPTQTNGKTSHSLDADIALLTQLLSGTGTHTGEGEGEDVTELLRRLEAAEDLAGGMEERLDGIMDSLDDLLSDLEARAAGGVRAGERAEGAVVVVEEEVAVVAVSEPGTGVSGGLEKGKEK